MAATSARPLALLRRVACPAVAGLAIGVLVHHLDLRNVARQLSAADPRWLAAGVVLSVLSVVAGAACWGVIARAAGIALSWGGVAVWSGRAAVAGQLVPGGAGGDAVRIVASRRVGAHVGPALGADLVARTCGAVAMTAWGLGGAFILREALSTAVLATAAGLFLGTVLSLLILVDGDLLIRPLQHREGRIARAVVRRLAPTAASLATLRARPAALAQGLLISGAGWGLNLAALVCMGRAVDAVVGWQVFAVVIPVSLVATLMPLAANGMGVREGILIGLLGRAGVAAAPGMALSVLVDLQLMPAALLGALVGLANPGEGVEPGDTAITPAPRPVAAPLPVAAEA